MQKSSSPSPPPSQQYQPRTDPFALGLDGDPQHLDLCSVLSLREVHDRKIYYSGRLSTRVQRGTDGMPPTKDEGWVDVWCQLTGGVLSTWNMREIEDAAARGEQVPPQYTHVADAFVQVFGSITFPATSTSPAERHTNVLTLNTTGSNLLLFEYESTEVLVSWAAALRLAAWEKSRLEEIYTAHLLQITFKEGGVWEEPRRTLVNSRLEGWVRVRVAGQTVWNRYWTIISAGSPLEQPSTLKGHKSTSSLSEAQAENSPGPSQPKQGLLSWLFSRSSHNHTSSTESAGEEPTIQFFNSSKPKDGKNPVLTVSRVTQAFAVYPERPDLITRSTLIKIEGQLGREEGAGALNGTEAWVQILPEVEGGQFVTKMLEWIIALHDAFKLYGRPQQYSFNRHDPTSLMFACPREPNLQQLFLEREIAVSIDPRDDATSIVRSRLASLVQVRSNAPPPPYAPNQPEPESGVGSSIEQPDTTGADVQAQPRLERSNVTAHASHSSGSASPFLAANATDMFVQVESNEAVTKASTLRDPLPTAVQDNQNLSTERQEALELLSGPSSHTPDKPPPSESGPLGAVAAHEHDQGFGAALTEREREQRMAEDRRRTFDDIQRQQLEIQQLMHSAGMNFMVTGADGTGATGPTGTAGLNPTMCALDPLQQLQVLAAQRAAIEAYHRTMLSFSQERPTTSGECDEDGHGVTSAARQ